MTETARAGTLHVRGLTVARGNRVVVDDVSLEVPPGEVTALLGPNGAGKSSLVLAVGGVLRPLAARSRSAKRTSHAPGPRRSARPASRSCPRAAPAAGAAVEDNLRVATYTLPRGEARAAREKALDLFPELRSGLGSQARLLSGGEQQMVVLAQALVSRPKVVLIDELSLGLAPVVVSRLIPTLRRVCEAGAGVLLIEQFATGRARARQPRVRDERRRDRVLGQRERAAREARAAPLGLPAARDRQGRGERAGVTVTAIDHILVLSDDIDATRDFYCRALGLTVGPRPPLEFPGYWLFGEDGPCVHIADRAVYNERARRLGLGTAGRRGREIDHVASFRATDYGEAAARLEAPDRGDSQCRPAGRCASSSSAIPAGSGSRSTWSSATARSRRADSARGGDARRGRDGGRRVGRSRPARPGRGPRAQRGGRHLRLRLPLPAR